MTPSPIHWSAFRRPAPTRSFSKLFTCDVVARWPWAADHPVTEDDLLAAARQNDDFAYRLLRAAGASQPNVHNPSERDLRAVLTWIKFFRDGPPLPTHDGLDDARLVSTVIEDDPVLPPLPAFCLLRRDPSPEHERTDPQQRVAVAS